MRVTRRVEFDAGHRVPDHNGMCRRPHGHRYAVEVAVESGEVPDSGMLIDFGLLKELLVRFVHEPLDHRFMVFHKDEALSSALRSIDPDCVRELAYPPTAENIAALIFTTLSLKLPATLRLASVKVWETPNCSAECVEQTSPFGL